MNEQSRPLQGLRVLAIEQMVAGPYGTMLLGDMGAEVIKIEPPDGGDQIRRKRFRVGSGTSGRIISQFTIYNRNKKSLTLNLKSESGKDVFRRLAAQADIVWSNLRPGALDELGLGYEALNAINARLIFATVSGFGHADVLPSPYQDRPAFDVIAQALSGLIHMTSGPDREPAWLGAILGDAFSGILTAFGVTLALQQRTITGLGQRVDMSMYDACMMLNERAIGLCSLTGTDFNGGNDPYTSPAGVFRCRDGAYLAIAAASERSWTDLCKTIGREDLMQHPELADPALRTASFRKLVLPACREWLQDKPRKDALEILTARGVPCAPVQTHADVLTDPHVAARKMLVDLIDPLSGPVKVVGNAIKLSSTPDIPTQPPPRLGEHTETVLRDWLGLDAQSIERLRSDKTI